MPDNYELEGQAYMDQARKRLYGAVGFIDRLFNEPGGDGVVLLQVSISGPRKTGEDFRAVLKGRDDKGALWVDFVNGETLETLHNNIREKGQKRGFKWREDKPFPTPL